MICNKLSLALEQKYTISNRIHMSSDLDTIRPHKKNNDYAVEIITSHFPC